MSMCSLLLCCWKRVFTKTVCVFSSQNSVSLCPTSVCTPRTNFPVTSSISWLPTFAFWSPIMKRTSFWVLVLEDLVGLHRTVQLQLLQHYWLRHRLGLLWYWMVCLGKEQRSLYHFWDCIQIVHFRLFLLKQPLCAPGPSNHTETESELCLSVSCGGTGQQWITAEAGALGAVDLGMA